MHLSFLPLLSTLFVALSLALSLPSANFKHLIPRDSAEAPGTLHAHEKRRGIGRIGGGIPRGSGGTGSTRPPRTTLPTSNRGGRTSSGSGISPAYGGFYAGGSRVPFRSGVPYRGVSPFLLTGAGLGFWAGGHSAWGPYGAYAYPFEEEITYKNKTTGKKQTVEVMCLCRRYVECSCEGNDGKAYVRALLDRSGSNSGNTVQVTIVNGSRTAVVNGTLANGTTASGAAGGGRRSLVEGAVWGVGTLVVASFFAFF